MGLGIMPFPNQDRNAKESEQRRDSAKEHGKGRTAHSRQWSFNLNRMYTIPNMVGVIQVDTQSPRQVQNTVRGLWD